MVLWHPIPGETPIEDLSGIKVKGIKVRKDLNEVEAKNITKAVEKYLERAPTKKMAPFDFVWALKLHREMFGDVWEWAGTLRQKEVNVGLPVLQIEIALDELMKNRDFWTDMASPQSGANSPFPERQR
jgi:fido (protein-threonine AMPylation protein)